MQGECDHEIDHLRGSFSKPLGSEREPKILITRVQGASTNARSARAIVVVVAGLGVVLPVVTARVPTALVAVRLDGSIPPRLRPDVVTLNVH